MQYILLEFLFWKRNLEEKRYLGSKYKFKALFPKSKVINLFQLHIKIFPQKYDKGKLLLK